MIGVSKTFGGSSILSAPVSKEFLEQSDDCSFLLRICYNKNKNVLSSEGIENLSMYMVYCMKQDIGEEIEDCLTEFKIRTEDPEKVAQKWSKFKTDVIRTRERIKKLPDEF